MKKIIILIIFAMLMLRVYANPIYVPPVWLFGFSFNELNEWKIDLAFEYTKSVDSIMITTPFYNVMYKNFHMPLQVGYWANGLVSITKDSLSQDLKINPDGDSVAINIFFKLRSNTETDSMSELVVFGNFKNASVPKPGKYQKITRFLTERQMTNFHCLSDSTGNRFGKVKGNLFDNNNNLIKDTVIIICPYESRVPCYTAAGGYSVTGTEVDSSGQYSANIYSMNYKLNTISLGTKLDCGDNNGTYFYGGYKTVKIKPIAFSVYPGTITTIDIFILDDISRINNTNSPLNELLKISPNPLNKTSFHYKIETPVKSTSCHVKLMNSVGQEIRTYKIAENEGDMQLPSNIKNGTYILQLVINSKTYSSTKLLVTLE